MRDPYAVLGLEPPATAGQVKAAYRARSMLLHPDLHGDRPAPVRREAERAMAQLTEAYEQLTGQAAAPNRAAAAAAPARGPLYRLGRRVGQARGRAAGGGYAFRLGQAIGRRRRGEV